MDNFAFDEYFEQERPQRNTKTKQAKRRWREIEAIKDKQRLKKELDAIDVLSDTPVGDVDF